MVRLRTSENPERMIDMYLSIYDASCCSPHVQGRCYPHVMGKTIET
jgi:hypothetical protein